ncbi:MAG: methionine--tRNA ligase, partial [Oscillospiraceae bacterium]|nr:methionine--tRNA ligase [Oscillospiraceae bacterium]
MDEYNPPKALVEIWKIVAAANKYIESTTPWELAKNPENRSALAAVLHNLLETLRFVSILIMPVMPESAKKLQEHLNLPAELVTWESASSWCGPECHKTVQDRPFILFPRIEIAPGA